MKISTLIICIIPFISFGQSDDELMIKKGMDVTKYIPKGLEVGEEAPKIIGYSLNGKLINSTDVLKEKQIVLIFYRGEWCPVCNRYLSNLNDSLQYIIDGNTEVFVVGPETFKSAKKISKKTNAIYTLIPDTSLNILVDYDVMFSVTKKYQGKIKTFLMTDIAKNNNQEEATLPVPATYIIGQDGKIKWRHFNYDYSVRATAKEIIDYLK
tara:strand:- start:2657 stop:3286 length:630 start_codon:yes stop_codon:yes gene_type:complete